MNGLSVILTDRFGMGYDLRLKIDSELLNEISKIHNFQVILVEGLVDKPEEGRNLSPFYLDSSFELFKKKCEEELDFNFSKTTFYNIILLDYYLQNKAEIAKWQMEHWTQDYYQKRDVENNKLEDVLKYINTVLDE